MSKRITICEDDDFKLSFEEEQGELVVHVAIYRAAKSVLERILWEFSRFKAAAWVDGYDQILTYTQDTRMFRIFGATEIGSFEANGQTFKVGRWVLNF